MTVRYTEDEIGEFLFGTNVEGLNREEIVEALNDWREHMEAGGYPVGTTDDQGAVDLLREARAILPHGAFAGHRHDERHDLIARIDAALKGQ